MIRSIHCSRLLGRQVAALRRAGKKGELAAAQFERILAFLSNSDPRTGDIYCKRTKNGEYRLKNCVKYDLGSGYRLVTIRIGDRLFIPFLGDHDAANLWLERHGHEDFLPHAANYMPEIIVCRDRHIADIRQGFDQVPEKDDLYEEQLLEKVDDSTLRDIFQGLCQKHAAAD